MKPYLELLPYRIDQAISGRAIRKLRVWHRRRKAIQPVGPTTGNPRRLFVDLAVITKHDAGTGIQRVVRALALALIAEASVEWDIHFVTADRRKAYHCISWPKPGLIVDTAEIDGQPGDVFLGLDFSADRIRQHRRQLARFRRNGGSLWFLVYDLLPVDRSEWFPRNSVIRYKAWLEIIAGIADGFLCISRQTEMELTQALADLYGLTNGYRTNVVPMGYSILDSVFHGNENEVCDISPRFNASAPFSLMVGTLEPRKGHADVIAAFSELWQEGAEDRLVLVGRMGWRVEELRDQILTHPEYGRKLMWFDDVGDFELEQIYQDCDGVIIASHAEGFGLPLIEALGHGKPVLARDLPIFRAHEALGVRYFPATTTAPSLAGCIRRWTKDVQAGRITVTPPNTCWKEAVRTLLSSIA